MNKLVEWSKSKLGCGYVLGSQGEIMTDAILNSFIKSNGKEHYIFDNVDAHKWIGKECYDCSGLIISKLLKEKLIKSDYVANDIYHSLCNPLKKDELVEGDLVFVPNESGHITHVGVYIGAGKVIEARGTAYGVVETELAKRTGFKLFGRLKFDLEEKEIGLQEATKILKDAGILADPTYWNSHATGQAICKGEHVQKILIAMARKLKESV